MTKILKKLDSKGKTRVWLAEARGDQVITTHGLDDGQLVTHAYTATAKNVGRSNATTAEQQAQLEVEALYTKKIERDGYKENLDNADTKIEVTLALDGTKVPHRIPDEDLWLSPKLDGARCLWVPGFGLQSRKGTKYSVPHIEAALQNCDTILDGELYIHGKPLNRILSAVKKTNELTPFLEFHVFDTVSPLPFAGRQTVYRQAVKDLQHQQIKCVEQVLRRKTELKETHDFYVRQGYEGLMVRVNSYPYEHRRSPSLFKIKDFQEAEYLVTDVEVDKEGNGVLVCGEFKARMRGEDAVRRHQAEHPEEYIGRMATIRYFAITEYGQPQFPVCVAFREDI